MLLHDERKKKLLAGGAALFIVAAAVLIFVTRAEPARSKDSMREQPAAVSFSVYEGESFGEIVKRLHESGIIESPFFFQLQAVIRGKAAKLKPGHYELYANQAYKDIIDALAAGPRVEVIVRIPEGSSVYAIDDLLSGKGIIKAGSLVNLAQAQSLEGKLFPDTYKFFKGSTIRDVVDKFLKNFTSRAIPILKGSSESNKKALIIASLLEREVPTFEDKRIISGIIQKRIKAGMPLQIDSSVCYIKEKQAFEEHVRLPSEASCHPVTLLDLKIDSPYNTYLNRGLPPGPIGNPGLSALKAATDPKDSSYWYYLNDPITKKTIFAETFDEHLQNKRYYLK